MKKLSLEQMEVVNGRGSGQKTMDCIADLYSKHGWYSLGLWIATGFVPELAVSAATACALKNNFN